MERGQEDNRPESVLRRMRLIDVELSLMREWEMIRDRAAPTELDRCLDWIGVRKLYESRPMRVLYRTRF